MFMQTIWYYCYREWIKILRVRLYYKDYVTKREKSRSWKRINRLMKLDTLPRNDTEWRSKSDMRERCVSHSHIEMYSVISHYVRTIKLPMTCRILRINLISWHRRYSLHQQLCSYLFFILRRFVIAGIYVQFWSNILYSFLVYSHISL